MDAECISRYGCRLDIQVLMQSGYPGMDAEWISRYGCIVDIKVLLQSGYPGMDAERISRYGCRVDIKVLVQSGYPGIDKIFSNFFGDMCALSKNRSIPSRLNMSYVI